ncbi:hypothetical protein Tco_1023329, partial [Tanacetum coccineum]
MEIPNTMISNAIKKLARYKFYMAKKVENENPKIVVKPEVQHVSTVKSRRGKGFICYGDQVANVPNKLKIDNVSRKTRSQTITKEIVVDTYAELVQKFKGHIVKDLAVQALLDLWKGSKASKLKNTDSDTIIYSSCLEESDSETDDVDDSDMDLSDDSSQGDDDAIEFRVFMHSKSTTTPNSTYISPMVTSSSLDFIHNLLNETLANELTDFLSAFEVPLGTHVDVQVTDMLLQEMFPDENAHHIPSLPTKKISYTVTTPQRSSLQAKTKKLMQKAKKNMRKINFKKADPLNNREGENKKKRRKDVGEPHSRSSRKNIYPMVNAQDDTPAIQRLDHAAEYVRNHLNPEWFPKKSRLTNDIRKTTWLKQQYQNDVELEYHVDKIKATILSEAKWNSDEDDVSKPRTFERHLSKNKKSHPSFYNNDYYYLVSLSIEEKYTTYITKHYAARYYKQ